jgi:hypothetical protein
VQFQSLSDFGAEFVFDRLCDSLAHWQQFLTEIKRTLTAFDATETQDF